MSHNSKKFALVALVSLQSAFMLAPGANPSSYSPLMSGVSQALADHATEHAAHAQVVAGEASDHAAAMQAVANHLSAQQQAAEVKKTELMKAMSVAETYIENSLNMRRISEGMVATASGKEAYEKAAKLITDTGREHIKKALDDLAQANDLFEILDKDRSSEDGVGLPLHKAIVALKYALNQIGMR